MPTSGPPPVVAPSTGTSPRKGLSIRALRNLIFLALFIGIGVFTGVMFTLTQRLSERFGPQVQNDLVWRVERGAQELSRSADLGLAVSDADMVKEAFGVYTTSADVQAIVAIDAEGKVVAEHGKAPEAVAQLFAGAPGKMRSAPGYLVAWAPAQIEGGVVGKVAVVVSTARQTDAQSLLDSVSRTALVAGAAMLILGCLVIGFFTHAVAKRDLQLKDYAANLERKVEERTAELDERNAGMRLVLDNVAQGFLTIDTEGVLASERSAIVDRWFGAPAAGATFADLIAPVSPEFADWFPFTLEALTEDVLPFDLVLSQMPTKITTERQTFEVAYSPILSGGKLERILVIVSDVTEHLARQRIDRDQRELVTLFQRISADRPGFDDFLAETNALVASLETPADGNIERRTIHTLKGNAGIYGLESYAEVCHHIEDEIADHAEPISAAQRATLTSAWSVVVARAEKLLGNTRRDIVEVPFADLVKLAARATQGVSSRDLGAVLSSWTHDPVQRRFERLGHAARTLAQRLGKGEIHVDVPETSLRLDAARWAPFWGTLIHAVRNAIDHGLEDAATRQARGKAGPATLSFGVKRGDGTVTISIHDNGNGIDWDALRRKAQQLGLPHATQGELVEVLFADGVSTREAASDTSGRGVGLGALRAAVRDLGGTTEVETSRGEGTAFHFVIPNADAQILPMRPPTQPLRVTG